MSVLIQIFIYKLAKISHILRTLAEKFVFSVMLWHSYIFFSYLVHNGLIAICSSSFLRKGVIFRSAFAKVNLNSENYHASDRAKVRDRFSDSRDLHVPS